MGRTIIFFISSLVIANPILTGVINEFQTDTILGQKFEFHPIQYGFEIPLLNTQVTTPAGVSYIDTPITNPPYGYTVIDNSILNGPFYLSLTSGYISVYLHDYFYDIIYYADTSNSPILAPPIGGSASRFIFFVANYPLFYLDWYIDHTPTLGSENDDYQGCVIHGYVYLNSVPVENAKVTASVIDSIVTPGPFYKTCTTYTNNNGYYQFDSLWPIRYWMTASFGNHSSGELSPQLCALWPRNLNFNFVGVGENLLLKSLSEPVLTIYPNPFTTKVDIKYEIQDKSYERLFSLKIYDASGRLVRQWNNQTKALLDHVVWFGDDDLGRRLAPGVYFIRFSAGNYQESEKVILIR